MGENLEVDSMMDYWIGGSYIGDTPEKSGDIRNTSTKVGNLLSSRRNAQCSAKYMETNLLRMFPSNFYKQAGTPEMSLYR